MKKIIIFLFGMFLFLGNISAQEDVPPYDLNDALNKLLPTESATRPAHLPGITTDGSTTDEKIELTGEVTDITNIMQKFANGLTGVAAALAVLFIILNCFTLVTAVGETDKISNAKKGLIWSLVGLILIVGAYVVVKTIIATSYSGG